MSHEHIGFARSINEVWFWLELHGCPRCGERSYGQPRYRVYTFIEPDYEVSGEEVDLTCPRCAFQRTIRVFHEADYGQNLLHGQLGGDTPSSLIRPDQFARELARCVDGATDDLDSYATMSDPELDRNNALWVTALSCWLELAKFVPQGDAEVPATAFSSEEGRAYHAAHPEQFTRAYLDAQAEKFTTIREAILVATATQKAAKGGGQFKGLPLPAFSLAALKFHEAWVTEGDTDHSQQIVAVGADARYQRFVRRNLSRIEATNSTLSECDFTQSTLDGAKLVNVDASSATFAVASFVGATLERCRLAGATFIDADLGDAVFTGCNLVRSNLSTTVATTQRVTFVDCDLREANLAGRDRSRITFTNCTLGA